LTFDQLGKNTDSFRLGFYRVNMQLSSSLICQCFEFTGFLTFAHGIPGKNPSIRCDINPLPRILSGRPNFSMDNPELDLL